MQKNSQLLNTFKHDQLYKYLERHKVSYEIERQPDSQIARQPDSWVDQETLDIKINRYMDKSKDGQIDRWMGIFRYMLVIDINDCSSWFHSKLSLTNIHTPQLDRRTHCDRHTPQLDRHTHCDRQTVLTRRLD